MSDDIRTLAALDRVDWTRAKLDALTDVKIQRELEPFRRERRDREASDQTQAMADVQACADTQARYQGMFSAYGETPPPAAGAEPDSYRRKLMRTVRDKLSVFDERRIDGVTSVGSVEAAIALEDLEAAIAFEYAWRVISHPAPEVVDFVVTPEVIARVIETLDALSEQVARLTTLTTDGYRDAVVDAAKRRKAP
jgi:hypothetical protein